MANFEVFCPDHYPMKCNLSNTDIDHLNTPEKYKSFFIYQYREQDDWLEPTLERYFGEHTWRLFIAGKESGLGTKFCNICRYALASDFGIVSLTPLNYNVFQEVGLMQGLQKPLLYILNPKRKDRLPFDIDDQIYVERTDQTSLETGLNIKLPLLIEKIKLLTGFEIEQKEMVKHKLTKIGSFAQDLLKRLLLEGDYNFQMNSSSFNNWITNKLQFPADAITDLREERFLVSNTISGGSRPFTYTQLNESYIKYLKEILF